MRTEHLTLVVTAMMLAIVLFFGGMGIGYEQGRRAVEVTSDTVVREVVVRDTISHVQPVSRWDSIIGSIRARVRQLEPQPRHGVISDTIYDSIFVELPRSQRRYDDSTYTAWVSGYEPRLDSIRVYQQTRYVTKEITAIQYSKRRKWSLGPQVSYGWNGRAFSPYVGVGVQYKILEW